VCVAELYREACQKKKGGELTEFAAPSLAES
jgi:hypothetical protein